MLANAYLHALDVAWEDKARGAKLVRYCDDYVILCRGNPQPWFQRMEKIVHGLGLSLNTEKTRIVDATDGFDFPGMHFRLKRNRSNPKRLYCYRWPATRAMQSVRQKVRDAVGYDDIYSLADKIRAVNAILRGWGQYFRIGNAHRHFKKVDSYVYTKLVNFLRRKHKRRGKSVATAKALLRRARPDPNPRRRLPGLPPRDPPCVGSIAHATGRTSWTCSCGSR